MRTLNLLPTPNQSFSVRLDDKRFSLRIREGSNTMLADIALDGAPLIKGTRILAGELIIPFPRLENGNFVLLTENDELPDWRFFNKSQSLVYMSAAQIEATQHG